MRTPLFRASCLSRQSRQSRMIIMDTRQRCYSTASVGNSVNEKREEWKMRGGECPRSNLPKKWALGLLPYPHYILWLDESFFHFHHTRGPAVVLPAWPCKRYGETGVFAVMVAVTLGTTG